LPWTVSSVNATNQVNTNQVYLIERSPNVNGPWTQIGTAAGLAAPGPQVFTDVNATNFPNSFTGLTGLCIAREISPCMWMETKLRRFHQAESPPEWRQLPLQRNLVVNDTAFGGFLRTGGLSFTRGAFDDMAAWNRVLSQAEIQDYIRDGINESPDHCPPVVFSPDVGFLHSGSQRES